jgi:hypothetical protein
VTSFNKYGHNRPSGWTQLKLRPCHKRYAYNHMLLITKSFKLIQLSILPLLIVGCAPTTTNDIENIKKIEKSALQEARLTGLWLCTSDNFNSFEHSTLLIKRDSTYEIDGNMLKEGGKDFDLHIESTEIGRVELEKNQLIFVTLKADLIINKSNPKKHSNLIEQKRKSLYMDKAYTFILKGITLKLTSTNFEAPIYCNQ